MKVFEIHALTTTTLRYKKPPIHNKDLTLVFPVELEKILDKFLSKYDISTDGFFFWNLKIDIWACVCFTEEHDIGGHVIASRKKKSNVVFTPFQEYRLILLMILFLKLVFYIFLVSWHVKTYHILLSSLRQYGMS